MKKITSVVKLQALAHPGHPKPRSDELRMEPWSLWREVWER